MTPRARSETMTSLFPIILGVVLIAASAGGARRNLLIGVALAATGLVGLIAPRLLPRVPQLSPERARARRVAAVILPNGVIYLALAAALRTALPPAARGGTTILIMFFALVVGVLSVLSGLGALRRARRPDDVPLAPPAAGPPENTDEQRRV